MRGCVELSFAGSWQAFSQAARRTRAATRMSAERPGLRLRAAPEEVPMEGGAVPRMVAAPVRRAEAARAVQAGPARAVGGRPAVREVAETAVRPASAANFPRSKT